MSGLTEQQMAALRARFGEKLDVEREVRHALDYAANFHRGRPYRNVGRMVWNWLLRSENQRQAWRAAGPAEERAPRVDARPRLSREQLEGLLEDELASVREMAADELRLLDSEAKAKHDNGTAV